MTAVQQQRRETDGLEVRLTPDAQKALEFMQNTTCQRCIHFSVCKFAPVLMGTVRQFMLPQDGKESELDPKSIPFELWDWAKICKAYAPADDPARLKEMR